MVSQLASDIDSPCVADVSSALSIPESGAHMIGDHTGDFLGIPATGRQVTMSGITIHRVTNGKLSEHWAQIDALSLLQQLGAVPR